MNIYSFLGREEADNIRFVENALSELRFGYHKQFRDKLLVIIESSVKGRLANLIYFEKEVAVNAELCTDEVGFIEEVSNDPEWQEYFFEEYPLVGDYLPWVYQRVRRLIHDVLNRLNDDFDLLELPPGSLLEHIDIGEGDFHDGKCTCRLLFDNGRQVFYKPRSLRIDVEMNAFFLRFQDMLGKDIFYPVKNIDRGEYGWSLAVAIGPCSAPERVKNHYEGLGIFTALAHAFKIEDIIFDNLIATNGRIALIDLECCLCTRIPVNEDAFYRFNSVAGEQYRNSLIHSGIIPRYTYEGMRSDGESDAALSYIPVRNKNEKRTSAEPENNATVADTGGELSAERHLPWYDGKPQLIRDYMDDYLEGFRLGYFAITANRSLFEAQVAALEAAEVETRIIYRPTKVYGTLLNESYHVDYLKSSESREALFRNMHNASHIGFSPQIVESEIRQLQAGDIPAFRKKIGINQVYACSGEPLGIEYAPESDTAQVRKRLSGLGEEDYAVQRNLIIQSVKIFEEVDYPEPAPVFASDTETTVYRQPEVERFLHGLVSFLDQRLLHNETSVSLLDSYININNGWTFGPIGPGLANGTDGLALTFAAYGHVFQKQEYTRLAAKIVDANAAMFYRHAKNEKSHLIDPRFVFSPFHFPSSILYAGKVMTHLQPGVVATENLENELYSYVNKWLSRDDSFDFLIGSCGAIFLFYQLYRNSGDARYLELTERCADHLCSHVNPIGNDMASWSAHKFLSLGGFSHGTASYSVGLLLAYDLLKKPVYFDLFEKALHYDRSLFSEERRQYRDNRHYPEVVYSHSWAHGSGGIGLSRLLMAELLPDYPGLKQEIDVCRANTEQVIDANITYSVSGGFAGNIELLRAFNRYCGVDNGYLDGIIQQRVAYYLEEPRRLETDNHHIQLLFNQGISGLAYALMRSLSPETLPSLLTLGITPHFGSKHLYGR